MRHIKFAALLATAVFLSGWTHGNGILSGPFTVASPFTIGLPPSYSQVGATVVPTAAGKWRTATGTECTIASTGFNLSPAANNSTDQYLVGNNNCTLSVESVSVGWKPRNALVQLFYPAVQAQRIVTIATGDGVTTRFQAIGGEAAPGGGTYGILPLYPKNGTVTLTAGAVTGTDDGSLLPNGKMSISGAGIAAATIVVLINNTYTDANLSTHAGYYDFTFDVAPANGVPITIALQYTWAPAAHLTGPTFDSGATYSMFRPMPSADDPAARAKAIAIASRTLTGSGIPVLDPAVIVSWQASGRAPIAPCVDMSSNCTHTGANSNYAAVASQFPENTVGNTYSWTAATKTFAVTLGGTCPGSRRVYAGFDLATAASTYSSNQVTHCYTFTYSKIRNNALAAPRILGNNVWVDYNEIYTDNFDPSILHVAGKGGCLAMNFFSSVQTGNKVRYNYLHDCNNDGFNPVNLDSFEVIGNRIEITGGLDPEQHPDGMQTQGNGGGNQNINGLISSNYVTCYSRFNAQVYMQFIDGAKIQSQCNASIYVQEFQSDTTANISVTNNFSDGGVKGFQFGLNVSPDPNVSLTNNISGTGTAYAPGPNGPFSPSPQTGNINAYSGAAMNVW